MNSSQAHSKTNKIIWFLIGNPVFTASSRIHGLAVHRELLRLGYNSHIAYLPEFIEEEIPFDFSRRKQFESFVQAGDIIILQKIKSNVNLSILNYLKQLGLKIVLTDCDLPIAEEVGQLTDRIICTSKALCNLYLQREHQSIFIEDCPEFYYDKPDEQKKQKLECYWFGDNTEQKWREVQWLEQIIEDPRLNNWKLVTISNHPNATIQWNPDFLNKLKEADVIAIPAFNESKESSVKSANRLLQSMALSVPAICSPLPSYTDVLALGEGGIICKTKDEWIEAFLKLEDNALRETLGTTGYSISQKFSISNRIDEWINALGLDENFKTTRSPVFRSDQNRLSNFFYSILLKKNLYYWKKMTFSFENLRWLFYSIVLKIKKRLI